MDAIFSDFFYIYVCLQIQLPMFSHLFFHQIALFCTKYFVLSYSKTVVFTPTLCNLSSYSDTIIIVMLQRCDYAYDTSMA